MTTKANQSDNDIFYSCVNLIYIADCDFILFATVFLMYITIGIRTWERKELIPETASTVPSSWDVKPRPWNFLLLTAHSENVWNWYLGNILYMNHHVQFSIYFKDHNDIIGILSFCIFYWRSKLKIIWLTFETIV